MKFNKILTLILFLSILFSLYCDKKSTEPENNEGLDEVFCKNSITNSNGSVTFTDNTTDEEITILVTNLSGDPLPNMNVQYLDTTIFECFIVEDPQETYKTSLRIYPHNSMHTITMNVSGPQIRQVNINSAEGQAIEKFVEYAGSEWIYMGRRTPEQLDAENEFYLFILKLFGLDFSIISDVAGIISEVTSLITNWEEPEYYDVYRIIPNNPITTSFRILIPVDENETNTITDIDGNVYKTIKIGNQLWMAENLKVTRYRNGDTLPKVVGNTEWQNLTIGGYCVYDNNEGNANTYGNLYNWHTVNDVRNIAPSGWHVPSDEDWKELELFLGMSRSEADKLGTRGTDEGGKLKETGTVHWIDPNTGATNETDFSALPGGYRGSNGRYYYMGYVAHFWSSTKIDNRTAWDRRLHYSHSYVDRINSGILDGFSIRCIKD